MRLPWPTLFGKFAEVWMLLAGHHHHTHVNSTVSVVRAKSELHATAPMLLPHMVREQVAHLGVVPCVKLYSNGFAQTTIPHVLATISDRGVASGVGVQHKGEAIGTVHHARLVMQRVEVSVLHIGAGPTVVTHLHARTHAGREGSPSAKADTRVRGEPGRRSRFRSPPAHFRAGPATHCLVKMGVMESIYEFAPMEVSEGCTYTSASTAVAAAYLTRTGQRRGGDGTKSSRCPTIAFCSPTSTLLMGSSVLRSWVVACCVFSLCTRAATVGNSNQTHRQST